jgi:hypothetical protein
MPTLTVVNDTIQTIRVSVYTVGGVILIWQRAILAGTPASVDLAYVWYDVKFENSAETVWKTLYMSADREEIASWIFKTSTNTASPSRLLSADDEKAYLKLSDAKADDSTERVAQVVTALVSAKA